ncbi:MAG: hypothetical protein ACRCXD_05075, partial [Luteolibacter sp.]
MKVFLIHSAIAFLVSITSLLGGDSSWRPGKVSSALVDPSKTPEELASSDWSSIREAYEHGRHAIVANRDGGHQARNPGQAWATEFDGRGFTVTPDAGGWTWGLELTGYGDRTLLYASSQIITHGNRASCLRDAVLTEWFINDTRGLEQGWTFAERPVDRNASQPLRLHLAVRGGLQPKSHDEGKSMKFLNESGGMVLTYSGLKAWDVDGTPLTTRFVQNENDESTFCIEVQDAAANYPITIDPIAQQAYLKASNTGAGDNFGYSVAISGNTVVISAPSEDSNATGINGNQADGSAISAGAVYVFVRSGGTWSQQAYIKASNAGSYDRFGWSVSISGDTLVVGAPGEASNATGVNGNQQDNSVIETGAAYVFVRSGTTWSQQAYLKEAANTVIKDGFGSSISLDGNTVVIGSPGFDPGIGAVSVFLRSGNTWSQQAQLSASNAAGGDRFGGAVAISDDTLIVGASGEDSAATGIGGIQSDNSASGAGAAYVFLRNGVSWSQQAYIKPSNTGAGDAFGSSVAISHETVVVGASLEDSAATGVNANQLDNSALSSGAAYVFRRNLSTWTQQAYLKAANTEASD